MTRAWDYLIATAPGLVSAHDLTLWQPPDAKKAILAIKNGGGQRSYIKGKWGKDYSREYAAFLNDHKRDLERDYPIERAMWPSGFRYLWTNTEGPPPDDYPWLAWFYTILGEPYSDFPPEMSWLEMIHQVWLERSRNWRTDWEQRFAKRFPEAYRLDVIIQRRGAAPLWERWRVNTFVNGFTMVEGQWDMTTIEALVRAQQLEAPLAELEAV